MRNSDLLGCRLRTVATIAVAWGLAAGLSVASMLAVAAPDDPAPGIAAALASQPGVAHASEPAVPTPGQAASAGKRALDRSGQPQFGKASIYANRYSGRTMADGTPMRPFGDNAASLTLPLGTTARVTNLATGQTAVVTIRDRGPYVNGRIIDLSPATAREIGLQRKQGLARVQVAPLTVPLSDGTVLIVSSPPLLAITVTPDPRVPAPR
jgi:rare lipoprotein A